MATGRIDILVAARDEASKVLKKTTSSVKDFSKALNEPINLLENFSTKMSAAFIVGAPLAFAAASIKAFDDMDAATRNLNSSLVAIGQDLDGNREGFQQLAAQIQATSEFSKEQILQAQAVSLSITGSAEATAGLTQVAADFAAATGRDFKDALFGVSKAALGKTEVLQELGIQIDKNDIATRGYVAVVEKLNEQFGGSAQALVSTFGGKIKQLGNDFTDVGAIFGERFITTILAGFDLAGIEPGGFADKVKSAFFDIDEQVQLLFLRLETVAKVLASPLDTAKIAADFLRAGSEIQTGFAAQRKQFAASLIDKKEIKDRAQAALEAAMTGASKKAASNAAKAAVAAFKATEAAEAARSDRFRKAAEDNAKFFADETEKYDVERAERNKEFAAEQADDLRDIQDKWADGIRAAFSGASGAVAFAMTEGIEAADTGNVLGDNVAGAIVQGIIEIAEDPEFFDKFIPAVGSLITNVIGIFIPELIANIGPLVIAIIDGFGAGFELLAKRLFSGEFWIEAGWNFRESMIEAFGGSFQEFGKEFGESISEIWPVIMAEFGRLFSAEFQNSFTRIDFSSMGIEIGRGMLSMAGNIGREISRNLSLGGGGDDGYVSGTGTFLDQYAHGTQFVRRTGVALLHKGETVTPADSGSAGVTMNLNISGSGFMRGIITEIAEAINDGIPEGRLLRAVVVA